MHPSGAVPLAKKPNYNFEKRKKELDRKAKRDEKIRNKRTDAAAAREKPESPEPSEESQATPE